MPMSRDTIAAIATAQGRGGVGIVRVSGQLAKQIAKQMTGRELKPRYAHTVLFMQNTSSLWTKV